MRKIFSTLLLALPLALAAQTFVNLTPRPHQMQVSSGSYTLPSSFVVGGEQLPDSIAAEGHKFVALFNRSATGASATSATSAAGAHIMLQHVPQRLNTLGPEGYQLVVKSQGITAVSATARGMYYALTSLRKMLPADIGAGVKDNKSKTYSVPMVSITDRPRYRYRGFMLDVARHFFTVEEVKRMIDLMALYKMNTFHFHLTDDQGWRWEVKRYPRLTQVGSVASNSYITAYKEGPYHTNAQYGPFFYTQQQLRDIVNYAAERHIEVIPEIDMPGHFVAAMASYPEYSCNPEGYHAVWTKGGISTDILNVGNPEAVQFAKNILDELMEIFPSKTIHIGGDECPTTAWESNEQCKARYKQLGLSDYRQLQSHFIKDIDEHVKSKGRRLAVWNEAITAKNADTKIMKNTRATVFCWTGPEAAAQKAASLHMPHIYTPWGPYYINRRSSDEPWEHTLPGNGSDHLKATYEVRPPQNAYTAGLQATFWTEHVGTAEVMEYLTLPRLMAIAEAAWTPQALRNFNLFKERMNADTELLDLGGYKYGRNFLDPAPQPEPPAVQHPTQLPKEGKTYMLRCTLKDQNQTALTDAAQGNSLTHSNDPRAARAWKVMKMQAYDPQTHTLKLQLQNTHTKRYIGTSAGNRKETLGFPVLLNANGAQWLTLTFDPQHQDYAVSTAANYKLFPIPGTSTVGPGTVGSGSTMERKDPKTKQVLKTDAVRAQGAAWELVQVRKITYRCTDEQGKALGTIEEYVPTAQNAFKLPKFKGYVLSSKELKIEAGEQDAEVNLVYRRTSYQLALTCQDKEGGLLRRDTISVPLEGEYTLVPPSIPYYTATTQAERLQLKDDAVRVLTYTTDALPGVASVAEAITEMADGLSVLLYDVSANMPKRAGYRSISAQRGLVLQSQLLGGTGTPLYTWTLQQKGTRYGLLNHATQRFLPEMVKGGDIVVGTTPGRFSFVRNNDADTWKVQGNNGLYWDGREGSMTGWNIYGHAYRLHRYFVAPYYRVVLHCEDDKGTALQAPQTSFVQAGTGYTLVVPAFKNKPLKSMSHSAGQLASVQQHIDLRLVYASPTGIAQTEQKGTQATGIHDLSGRRVQPTRPGLYIIEGRKVIVR